MGVQSRFSVVDSAADDSRGGPGQSSTTAAGGGVGVDRPTVRPRALDPGDGLVGWGRSGDRRAGAASRRISWDDVEAAQPDVVVVAACGYDRARPLCPTT